MASNSRPRLTINDLNEDEFIRSLNIDLEDLLHDPLDFVFVMWDKKKQFKNPVDYYSRAIAFASVKYRSARPIHCVDKKQKWFGYYTYGQCS